MKGLTPPPAPPPSTPTGGGTGILNDTRFKIAIGNFARITQRLMWETGAILVMVDQFDYTLIKAALLLGIFGLFQTTAQIAYARTGPWNKVQSLQALGEAELLGLILIFGPSGSTNVPFLNTVFQFAFFVGSIITYCSNCVTAAPLNGMLLSEGGGSVDRESLLYISQYGIFLGFIAGPIAVRGIMYSTHDEDRNILASVLLFGWVVQALITVMVLRGDGALRSLVLISGLACVWVLYVSIIGTGDQYWPGEFNVFLGSNKQVAAVKLRCETIRYDTIQDDTMYATLS